MDDDIPLLNTPNLVALILREAGAGGATADGCADRLEPLLDADAPVGRDALLARCARRIRWLAEARLIEPGDGRWLLTGRGRQALADHPDGMDLDALSQWPEFAAYLDAHDGAERPGGSPPARASAHDEGLSARLEGAAFTDNPHDFGTLDHQLWEKGWCEEMDAQEGPGRSAVTGRRRDAN